MPHSNYIGSNGERWPSATELTQLLPNDWQWAWYQKEVKKHGWRGWQWCKAYSNRAMRLGTHVHGFVEMALTGKSYRAWLDDRQSIMEPQRRQVLIEAWANALYETTVRNAHAAVEKKVINNKNNEHGTIDCISIDDETNKVFPKDWKTSGAIRPEYAIQLAIYNRCMEANGEKTAGYGEIERVDKELKSQKRIESGQHHVQVKRFNDLAHYYPVIDALHVIWDYVNKQGAFKKQAEAVK